MVQCKHVESYREIFGDIQKHIEEDVEPTTRDMIVKIIDGDTTYIQIIREILIHIKDEINKE